MNDIEVCTRLDSQSFPNVCAKDWGQNQGDLNTGQQLDGGSTYSTSNTINANSFNKVSAWQHSDILRTLPARVRRGTYQSQTW